MATHKWTLSPYQHDIYGNSLENVVYGYPTLIQQSPVIDFVVDSKHNHLIWIASYLDSSAAVFSKKLGHSDRVSLIQKINYLSSNSIPKFLIQDFDSLNRFYYTVESYQTVQKDSHHVKNLTSIWKMPGLKKDSDKCIKHENASLTLCPMNTSWLLESKPSILGNSGISIELLANQQLIWTSLKWNTFFELFSHNKYSHNSIYAYNLEPGLSNCEF
ncbi:unnamed protein product [Trichobilharzia regenti]|nr:unnamed protein product [Trichobilharzia regenti]